MAISTRLTCAFGIRHPIVMAPLDAVGGADLAMAVSRGGGLGMLGGGYGDRGWLEAEYAKAGDAPIGCGFITWSMAREPGLLDLALERRPKALMLSFADPEPFARRVLDAGVPLFCQVHSLEHVRRALDVGASAVVAQGVEAGGHGRTQQGTITFVPEVADFLRNAGSDALLIAAGGLADGRGLAAALMLGADGALFGTRYYATREAAAHPDAKAKLLACSGGSTVRTTVYDIVRGKAWPDGYTARLMRNRFVEAWHGRENALVSSQGGVRHAYDDALSDGDFEIANVTVGEAAALIHDLPSAEDLTRRIGEEAEALLSRGADRLD
jgi:nitronate monooxygenase